jgi:hypothetical protein
VRRREWGSTSTLIPLYRSCLRLYPADFRAQFAEEMTAVFTEATMAARRQSRWAITLLCLREGRDLPFNLAREHWHSVTKGVLAMTTIYRKPEWFFYPSWVVLTTLSFYVAFALMWLIVSQVGNVVGGTIVINGRSHITEDYLAVPIFVPLLGLIAGLLQYPLLRRYLPRMGWWIGATTLGWLSATAIIFFLTEGLTMNANWFVFWIIPALIGGSVGFAQWLVLRRRVARAGWWIPATMAGWLAVRLAAGPTLVGPLEIFYLTVLPALATAVTLGLLIRRAVSPELKAA